jgi:dipeptidyl-peptidase-4
LFFVYLLLFFVYVLPNAIQAHRGLSYERELYRKLGTPEIRDQLAFVHWIRQQSYVSSVAVWGWSYGGYSAIQMGIRGGSDLSAVVAVAPVVDWRFYDSVYTERFMGTVDDNVAGYDASSVLSKDVTALGR